MKVDIIKRKGMIGNTLNESYLNEALGEFATQYSIADEISEVVLDMIRLHTDERYFSFKGEYRWKKCNIKIIYSEDSPIKFMSTSAVYQGSSDTEIHIDIKLSRNDVLSLSQNELKNKLIPIIAHELNHGHTVVNTYNATGDIPAYPKLYNKVVNIIQGDIDTNSIVYKFAYGVYITSYLEVPAFVSQTTPDLERLLKNVEYCSVETFKEKIQETEPYTNYKDVLDDTIPEIKRFGISNLAKELQQHEIFLSFQELNLLVRRMKQEAKSALKNVVRNAMIYYEKHVQQSNTKWYKNNF